jgi:exodeoxyribonuclease VII small subunit
MPRSASPKPVDQLTYEAAFAELQTIIEALEGEQSSLNEATSLYERGQSLVKRCSDLLDKAELKIRTLSGSAAAGLEED